MTDDLGPRFKAAAPEVGLAPLDDVVERGRRRRRERRRRTFAGVAGGLVVVLAALVLVLRPPGNGVSLNVTGSPGASLSPAEARDVAVASALLRYGSQQEIQSPGPVLETIYVLDHYFVGKDTPTMFDYVTGSAIPEGVQAGLARALAPSPVSFVPDPATILPTCMATDSPYVYRLGAIPESGSPIPVFLGVETTHSGFEETYNMRQSGDSWQVSGTVGNGSSYLALCG